jgi:hypothetical protein
MCWVPDKANEDTMEETPKHQASPALPLSHQLTLPAFAAPRLTVSSPPPQALLARQTSGFSALCACVRGVGGRMSGTEPPHYRPRSQTPWCWFDHVWATGAPCYTLCHNHRVLGLCVPYEPILLGSLCAHRHAPAKMLQAQAPRCTKPYRTAGPLQCQPPLNNLPT